MQVSEVIEDEVQPQPKLQDSLKNNFHELFASGRLDSMRPALIYLIALLAAEGITAYVDPGIGMAFYGIVLLMLLLHAALWAKSTLQRFLLSLALVPLIRIISLSVPIPNVPIFYWYLIVGMPLFLASFLAARMARLNWSMLGLTLRALPIQLVIGLTGLGLGFIEYQILHPEPLTASLGWRDALIPALILLVFTGFLEEFIFRGIMQYTALVSLGRFSLLYVPAVFALLHISLHSAWDIVFAFFVAVYFGWLVLHTSSIVGVSLAHGLMNIGLFLVFPFLIAKPISTPGIPITGLPSHPVPTATITPTSAVPVFQPSPSLSVISPTPTLIPATSTTTQLPVTTATAGAPLVTAAITLEVSPTSITLEASPTSGGLETAKPTQSLDARCGRPKGWVIYIVRSGDSLSELSQIFGVSWNQLLRANCLRDPGRLFAGQPLWVPFVLRLPALAPTPIPTSSPMSSPTAPEISPSPPAPTLDSPTPMPSASPTSSTAAPELSPSPPAPTLEPPTSTLTPIPETPIPPTDTPTIPPTTTEPAPTNAETPTQISTDTASPSEVAPPTASPSEEVTPDIIQPTSQP